MDDIKLDVVVGNENGLPVIYRFINSMPSSEVRQHFPLLMVISWPYEGESNNGMPITEKEKMIALEDAIESIDDPNLFTFAYSRTGNNLKEFIYYLHDEHIFMEKFNKALADHPKYPIEINFYNDENWLELQKLLDDFKNATNGNS